MTFRFLDSATGPSLAAAQAARSAGYDGWFGYVGPSAGWRSAMWPDECFANVKAAGLATAGIFFGPDAGLAVSECHRLGLGLCFGDVESDDPGQYEPGWIAGMNQAGIVAGPYGLRRTVAGMTAPIHWFAGEHGTEANTLYQHTYNTTFAGIAVDINDGDLSIPGVTPVDINLKRALVWPVRILAGHAWPENQQVVDFYASQVADDGSNVEDVFGKILTDAKAGGRTPLWEAQAAPDVTDQIAAYLAAHPPAADVDPTPPAPTAWIVPHKHLIGPTLSGDAQS